jgi:heat shock protein HtpX
MTALLLWIGQALGGSQGLVLALVMAGAMNIGSWWFSDRIVLRMYGARELSQSDAPDLYSIVHELALSAGMPMPRLYMVPSEAPNAFATGRSPEHAAVAVTQGIMRMLSRAELRAVLAHELSHVRNRDTLISAIAATPRGRDHDGRAHGAVRRDVRRHAAGRSRGRERARAAGDDRRRPAGGHADPDGGLAVARVPGRRQRRAHLHSPNDLASALEKIASASDRLTLPAGPATAHLWIVNPLHGSWIANLFSTHPPVEERIGGCGRWPTERRAAPPAPEGDGARESLAGVTWTRTGKANADSP